MELLLVIDGKYDWPCIHLVDCRTRPAGDHPRVDERLLPILLKGEVTLCHWCRKAMKAADRPTHRLSVEHERPYALKPAM